MKKIKGSLFLITGLLIIILASCRKKDIPTVPVVTTTNITEITQFSAKIGGEVIDNGGQPIIARGICWNTSNNPVITDHKTSDGEGDGAFISNLTELDPGTLYYARAYATNSVGTGYGISISFTTEAVELATVAINSVLDITGSSFLVKGEVTASGGGSVTSRGFCWSQDHNPTTSSNSIKIGTGLGSFETTISGLQSATTYYIRAWASNQAGTSYGNEKEVKTLPVIPTVVTGTYEDLTYNSVKLNGSVTSDGGSAVLGRGFCYSSTNDNPAFSENNTPSGAGLGTFSSIITNVLPETDIIIEHMQ
jgi:hypothetical protein